MREGLWQHCDLVAGRYSFFDLLDAHELLNVKNADEVNYRSAVASRQKQEQERA